MDESEEEKKMTDRVGLATMMFLPMMAVFFDILDLIPGVSVVAAIGYWVVAGIWLFLLGVSPFNVRRIATAGVSVVVGIFPFLSALPQLTIATIITLAMIKSEDKLGIKLPLVK